VIGSAIATQLFHHCLTRMKIKNKSSQAITMKDGNQIGDVDDGTHV
jgi:hypothetical protein